MSRARPQRGVTLVELIVFIVVVGTAAMGVLLAIDVAARSSADPMIQKQALAVAESLLEEVQLQPFTYCDPDDPNAAAARSAADCTGGANGPNDENRLVAGQLGPEGGETRTSATTPASPAGPSMARSSAKVAVARSFSGWMPACFRK